MFGHVFWLKVKGEVGRLFCLCIGFISQIRKLHREAILEFRYSGQLPKPLGWWLGKRGVPATEALATECSALLLVRRTRDHQCGVQKVCSKVFSQLSSGSIFCDNRENYWWQFLEILLVLLHFCFTGVEGSEEGFKEYVHWDHPPALENCVVIMILWKVHKAPPIHTKEERQWGNMS